MQVSGAFELEMKPGTPDDPASVRLVLQKAMFDPSGRVFVTPECASYDELEGHINALQHELDAIRERARRAFQVT
jgi:hypothetical protein